MNFQEIAKSIQYTSTNTYLNVTTHRTVEISIKLEDTSCYAGLLLASAEGFGLQPGAFFALRAKTKLIMLFWPYLGHFLVSSSNPGNILVVTLVTLKKNKKRKKKIYLNKKNPKKSNFFYNWKSYL